LAGRVLELARGLDHRRLDAIAALEADVVAVDGGRLKLEWGALTGRPGDTADDALWWSGERLVGFMGIYSFGSDVEITGMVDPGARREGIGSRLLNAVLSECGRRGHHDVLLIVPRASRGGQLLAQARGGQIEHSEYALIMTDPPAAGSIDPAVSLRAADPADAPVLERLLTVAFDHPATAVFSRLAAGDQLLVVERDAAVIGTLRVTSDVDGAGVYGFAIDPDHQGRGIGRDVLRRVCAAEFARGGRRVHLEVEADNARALGLYTSLGFRPENIEDYYRISTGG